MVRERRRSAILLVSRGMQVLTLLVVVLMSLGSGGAAGAADDTVRLTDAVQAGTFNVGGAQASVSRVFDPELGGNVSRVRFQVPEGTAAGVWAKGFPGTLSPAGVAVVRLGARLVNGRQPEPIALALEIKGTAGTQRVALNPGDEWSFREEGLNWPAIGKVNEVVLIVSREGHGEPLSGSVDLDVRFARLSLLRQLSIHPAGRVAGVLMLGCLGALFVTLIRGAARSWRKEGEPSEAAPATGLARDFIEGAGVAMIAALAIGVYVLGEREPLQAGWSALGVAVAGALVSAWWTRGLTGRHLTSLEVVQDVAATGLLAVSSSRLVILQVPAAWPEVLLLSQTIAAAAVVLYHTANAVRLVSTGRHLGAVAGTLIVGTPFFVGSLTLLESSALLQQLGSLATAGALSAWPTAIEVVGRVVVVFGFNVVVAVTLSVATKRVVLRQLPAYLTMLAAAGAVVAAPWIAAYGSGAVSPSAPAVLRLIVTVVTTVLSQAGLWAEGYLITGFVLDALRGRAPDRESTAAHALQGLRKGAVYSGTFMGILYALPVLWELPGVRALAGSAPLILAAGFGALAFPLAKTIIETFDGSQAFFRRVGQSYRSPLLYFRGAVVGLGLGYGLTHALAAKPLAERVWFGLGVGVAAFAGVNLVRDLIEELPGRGRRQSWRVYLVDALLGGFIGGAIGFYLDSTQVTVVVDKFHRYLGAGWAPELYGERPLLSKWGFINLGTINGGVSLLFCEALAGVISWSIPAWLFALNRTFMAAYFRRETAPIRALFTRDGLTQLTQNMIEVLRWGLWMSPIIKSFLRPMGEPTWYNQDGAVRTVWAIVQDVRLSPAEFRAWSLQVFIALLAYDSVRILIWLDHMGLRVATLVNLSFLGMDRLEGRLARFRAPAATARCIPEAIKRFTTWAPLLIPFYIPRGGDWDYAWSQSEVLQRNAGPGPIAVVTALPWMGQTLVMAGAALACTAVFTLIHRLERRWGAHPRPSWSLANTEYEVVLGADGEVLSRTRDRGYDVSRRSYDLIDPSGRALFVVDCDKDPLDHFRCWPVVGNYPAERATAPRCGRSDHALVIAGVHAGLKTNVAIRLPDAADPVELWTIGIENLSDAARRVKVVPYLEWVLNRPDADRGHTQYNRLFAEMEYVSELHAVLAWDKHSKALGILAAEGVPEGFLTSRVDFIGRARSLWTPRALETLAFTEPVGTEAHPTFDPIGSLLLDLTVAPRGSAQIRLLIGLVRDKAQAIDLVARHLGIADARAVPAVRRRKTFHPIGHGEVPPGTPQPYSEFSEDGRTLLVHTPFTPRPIDHALSNWLGHVVALTNRGLHTTSSVNAQQNRLTPDWPDTVTREVPGEAFYLYDPERAEWYAPTYHPVNDPGAVHEVEFSVDGSATYRMMRDGLETELTVFVPPEDPAGVYLLTVRNTGDRDRRLRLAAYFQMVLADQPEHSGTLDIQCDRALGALFFENPRNSFRSGPAFAALSCPADLLETSRGRFFGAGRSVAHPALVERGAADPTPTGDDRPVAAFLATLHVPARGETTVVVVLGQADRRDVAEDVIRRYRDPVVALASLEESRRWWLGLMETVSVQTSNPEFDRYLNWLKYQALAERIWARRGFYQSSGAYGFRDQLQDSVNLMWVDPELARRQILLHASQQFLEGDVVHWFHRLQDGRTGFAARTHASDNLLWLVWAVVDYLAATGDRSLLQERTSYLEAEQPFIPLPQGKHGMGFDPLRSAREDTVYRHCLKAIDLVLEARMGAHGLPLIGTGDWNDGLDEIGSEGRGESVWLGFFLVYILERMSDIIGRQEGTARQAYYGERLQRLKEALEQTWRGDRYLRAIHDDGTEIGLAGSGVWEIDALTAAWAVMAGVNRERGRVVFDTAVRILEKETTILLGWPPLREDTRPYLGRSSGYPEGVRENGMYCHGVQWLVGAARILAEQCDGLGQPHEARTYRETAYRLWLKISPIPHVAPDEIETYGGQPNKQAADMVTTFDPGRMIWHGYTGAAGWMFRQALEGVLGFRLDAGKVVPPADLAPCAEMAVVRVVRDTRGSPFPAASGLRLPAEEIDAEQTTLPN